MGRRFRCPSRVSVVAAVTLVLMLWLPFSAVRDRVTASRRRQGARQVLPARLLAGEAAGGLLPPVPAPALLAASSPSNNGVRLHLVAGSLTGAQEVWAALTGCQVAAGRFHILLYVDEDHGMLPALLGLHPPAPGCGLTASFHATSSLLPSMHAGDADWILLARPPLRFSPMVFAELSQLLSLCPSPAGRVTGVSLSALNFDWVHAEYEPSVYPLGVDAYQVLRHPQLRAGVFPAWAWRALLDWHGDVVRLQAYEFPGLPLPAAAPLVEALSAQRFFALWGQPFLQYMLEHNQGVLYLPERWQLAQPLPARPLSPPPALWGRSQLLPFGQHLPPPDRAPAFGEDRYLDDFLHQAAQYAPRGHMGAMHTGTFGACTMILTVYSRHATILDRLRFFERLMCLRRILVVWNAVAHPIPRAVAERRYRIPVRFLAQHTNSLNNRFFPYSLIDTDCILNMDDDWNMPHSLLYFAVRLWQSVFPDNLVGMKKLGRLHAAAPPDPAEPSPAWQTSGVWYRYATNKTQPHSIVLPSGMVYHRKYLQMYTRQLPRAARQLVDETTNCDDLLFNLMVANATGEPPVFVSSRGVRRVHVLKSLESAAHGGQALWKRRKHYTDRHRCLNEMGARFFGHSMPLRFSAREFVVDNLRSARLPDPGDHIPEHRWACSLCPPQQHSQDDCVLCRQAG